MRSIFIAMMLLCFAFVGSTVGQIVLVRSAGESSVIEEELELASRFYGVHLRTITLQTKPDAATVLAGMANQDVSGVVVSWSALPALQRTNVINALQRENHQRIPMLIAGVVPQPDYEQLAKWSNGALSGCEASSPIVSNITYVFGVGTEVTRQLAGERMPSMSTPSCVFGVTEGRDVEPILSTARSGRFAPVFVQLPAQRTFYLVDMKRAGSQEGHLNLVGIFSQIAPVMMFLRNALGDRAWHGIGHYANLSIDDAWLIEPYGHLDYATLLPEMERHNFHTTISFIPWNYDRSHPDAVSLFRTHGDRLSVCIHGNNHDHREFADLQTVPLGAQVANIQQALARMHRFTELTGVSYDPVMVFPHDTGPESTLAELKKYGFLATAYSLDLPLGATVPTDPLFYLRTFNLDFANFPGLKRYFAEKPPARIELAINAFLDNPLLFYGHEDLFNRGIRAFNTVADDVNGAQPNTRWCSLGCVSRHLYRVRRREDGNIDAELFSSDVVLENRDSQDELFLVKKAENLIPAIHAVTVDGQMLPFTTQDESIGITVFVPAGQSRNLRIEYANDSNMAAADPSKTNVRVTLLRRISDFRDLTLSRYSWGRALTRFYYDGGLDSVELKVEQSIPAIAILIVLVAALVLLRIVRRRSQIKVVVSQHAIDEFSPLSK
jgi:hypothetical protein